MGTYVVAAQKVVADKLKLPAGYSIAWAGQYEYMLRAEERLKVVVPLTLAIIMLLLYINFRNMVEVFIIMGTVPFALIGGIWLMYWLDYNISIAVAVGFIALAGVAVEIGVLMLVYLNHAYQDIQTQAQTEVRKLTKDDLKEADQKFYINEVLKGMAPNESLVLRLFYLNENSVDEICEMTGWAETKVKVTLHRARKSMEQKLKKLLNTEVKSLI